MAQNISITPFANLYGVNHRWGSFSGSQVVRSLYTPVNTNPTNTLDVMREIHQQENLFGFTTRELSDIGALMTFEALPPSSLEQSKILPFLDRNHWERTLDPNSPRQWIVQEGPRLLAGRNDLVWKELRPCLVLASYMFEAAWEHKFADTIFGGDRHPVESDRIPHPYNTDQQCHLWNVRPKPNPWVEDHQRLEYKKKSVMNIANRVLILGFAKSDEETMPGIGPQDPPRYKFEKDGSGMTTTERPEDGSELRIHMFINKDLFRPLLTSGLPQYEKYGRQWLIATTICHELMHVFAFCARSIDVQSDEDLRNLDRAQVPDRWLLGEPYYMEEPTSELGDALEYHIFGARSFQMIRDQPGQMGFWLNTAWPTSRDKAGYMPVLNSPKVANYMIFFPLKVQLLQDVQSRDYWNVGVRRLGSKLHYFDSLKEGVRLILDQSGGSIPNQKFPPSSRLLAHFGDPRKNKIHEIYGKMNMSQIDRDFYAFARTIKSHATANKCANFWVIRDNEKKRLLAQITSFEQTKLFLFFLFETLVVFREEIEGLRRQERGRNNRRDADRKNFFAFIRGIETFADELARHLRVTFNIVSGLKVEIYYLRSILGGEE